MFIDGDRPWWTSGNRTSQNCDQRYNLYKRERGQGTAQQKREVQSSKEVTD